MGQGGWGLSGCAALRGPGHARRAARGLPPVLIGGHLASSHVSGTFETIGFTQIYNMMEGDDDRNAGDFGFDPLGLLPGNEVQYKTAELTHGRAAMLAFSAVATQSALPTAFGLGKVRRDTPRCTPHLARAPSIALTREPLSPPSQESFPYF